MQIILPHDKRKVPPKLCSLRVPDVPELAEWIPSPGFVNRYPVIKNVNEAIKKMNLDDDLNFLNSHLQGIKMLKSYQQYKFESRPGSTRIWRESAVFEKLHYTMENTFARKKLLSRCSRT